MIFSCAYLSDRFCTDAPKSPSLITDEFIVRTASRKIDFLAAISQRSATKLKQLSAVGVCVTQLLKCASRVTEKGSAVQDVCPCNGGNP